MKRELFLKYITLFCIGAFLYTTIEICFRGYSFYAMMLLGGALFVAIDSINDYLPWDLDLTIQALIGASLITLSELIIGEVTKLAGAAPMWDYSNLPFNFDSVICIPFFLIWILLSVAAIILSDSINYYLLHIEDVPQYKIFNKEIRFPEIKGE